MQPRPVLVLLNKPFNVMSQFSPDGDKRTLAEFIAMRDVHPAGRLDHDSEGLLMLTNVGRLQHWIADPAHKLPKTYLAQVEGVIDDAALHALQGGVTLNDGPTRPALARRVDEPRLWERHPPIRYRANIPTSWVELTITEGRNRQVRRMTAATGFPTLRLVRVAIGPWSVEGIAPGESRVIFQQELIDTLGEKAWKEITARKPDRRWPGAVNKGKQPGTTPAGQHRPRRP